MCILLLEDSSYSFLAGDMGCLEWIGESSNRRVFYCGNKECVSVVENAGINLFSRLENAGIKVNNKSFFGIDGWIGMGRVYVGVPNEREEERMS